MFDKLKDLGGLMQQAQAMQQKVQELQAELERMEIVGSSGAGLVKVTVNGKNETRKVEAMVQEQMKSITGGLPLPPGFKI